MLSWITAGESHGPKLTSVISGMVSGLPIDEAQIKAELARRRLGYGRGSRMQFEQDQLQITAGVRQGKTITGPIVIEILNSEWKKWEQVMSSSPIPKSELTDQARAKTLTRPRPGHADLVGALKYGFTDIRDVLERSSARETAARVAAGAIAKIFLQEVAGISVVSQVTRIGRSHKVQSSHLPIAADLPEIDASPVRTLDKIAEASMLAEIDKAKQQGDTLGGEIEIVAHNVPLGMGDFSDNRLRLDSKIAAAMLSIQAIKAVEFGDGFQLASLYGSEAQDEINNQPNGKLHFTRLTNHAGGIEGGMSNGSPIVVKIAMKPISTVPFALNTIDLATGENAKAIAQRSDICAVPAAGVVAEAMLALTLSEVMLEKLGGDSLAEVKTNLANYQASWTKVFPNLGVDD